MRIVYFFIAAILISSCAQKVSRIDPGQQIDLSGRWNDSDSRQVAEKMTAELLNSPRYQEYAKELGKRPTIIVGLIRNRTSEHIDANNYIKKFDGVDIVFGGPPCQGFSVAGKMNPADLRSQLLWSFEDSPIFDRKWSCQQGSKRQ